MSIIPLYASERDNRSLRIPYSILELRGAPHRAPGTAMSHKEEANLFRHYGVGHGFARPPAGQGASPGGRTRGAGRTMLHEYAVSSATRMN